jgi:hypothetical protein
VFVITNSDEVDVVFVVVFALATSLGPGGVSLDTFEALFAVVFAVAGDVLLDYRYPRMIARSQGTLCNAPPRSAKMCLQDIYDSHQLKVMHLLFKNNQVHTVNIVCYLAPN